ncbi:hypothetical protein [Trichodesmium erythraeum]|nr:hypothetical protein [Trichodesmium sp. St11_bin5]
MSTTDVRIAARDSNFTEFHLQPSPFLIELSEARVLKKNSESTFYYTSIS